MSGNSVVCFKNACKYYVQGRPILDGFDMNVPRGKIYGLLGPSGCGKTTLLSCIVGTRKLNSGEVLVFGKIPGTGGRGIPGPKIGYMPQENTSLTGELTVKDCAYHFGWIHGMTDQQIEERYKFVEELLELPPRNSFYKYLSGGQQRRVSLAVALIHNADLLILDEPTVGLDPVLCRKIWDFFVKLTAEEHKTVILTTHYVEEARQAHNIGLMRNGKLLCEGSPDTALEKYNTTSIEQVFLLLSTRQEEKVKRDRENKEWLKSSKDDEIQMCDQLTKLSCEEPVVSTPVPDWSSRLRSTYAGRQRALLTKNLLRILRDPGGITYMFILPFLHTVIFILALSNNAVDEFHVAVVNKELGNYSSCSQYYQQNYFKVNNCSFENLGCHLLDTFQSSHKYRYKYEYFKEMDDAMKKVKDGDLRAALYFPTNFSSFVQERFWNGIELNGEHHFVPQETDLELYLDATDSPIASVMEKDIYDNYFKHIKEIIKGCGLNPDIASIPIKFNTPIYRMGGEDEPYGLYLVPGCSILLAFFLGVSLSSLVVTIERLEGVWDRLFSSGVTITEILISHMMVQGFMATIQSLEIAITSTFVFGSQYNGSVPAIITLFLLQGFCGVSLGFAFSVVSNSPVLACFLATGTFASTTFISGVGWPIEAMPKLMYWVMYYFPTTAGVHAIRKVGIRGWHLLDVRIMMDYLAQIIWIVVTLSFCVIVTKFRNRKA